MKIITYPIKKISVVLVVIVFQVVLSSSVILKLSGAHEESTGAPNEKTCAQTTCHADASVSPGTLVNTFTFNGGDSVYTPGETYPIKNRI